MSWQLSPSLVEGIGSAAGILTTLAFVPQVIKTWRSQSADDLSAMMLATFTIGILLWLVYGLALASRPLVLSNAVTLSLTAFLLIVKTRRDG